MHNKKRVLSGGSVGYRNTAVFITCEEVWPGPPIHIKEPTIIQESNRRAIIFPSALKMYNPVFFRDMGKTLAEVKEFLEIPLYEIEKLVVYLGLRHQGIVEFLAGSGVRPLNVKFAHCNCFTPQEAYQLVSSRGFSGSELIRIGHGEFNLLVRNFINFGRIATSRRAI